MTSAPAPEVDFSGRTQVRSLVTVGVFLVLVVLVVLAWTARTVPAWLGVAGTVVSGGSWSSGP